MSQMRAAPTSKSKRAIVWRVIWGLGIAALVTVALFLIRPLGNSSFAPLPNPNGYDFLVRAAAQIIAPDTNIQEMTTNELAALVVSNKAALAELRRGLELPCAVPVRMSVDWLQTRELRDLKGAAKAMDAEALFLYQQGDITTALNTCVDVMRFGEAISQNGVLINFLVGSACEIIAVRRMTNLLSSLSAEDCKRAVRSLEEREVRREPLVTIIRREKEWSQKTYGFVGTVRWMIETRSFTPEREWESVVRNRYQELAREGRTAMLKLASRAFELQHRRKPKHVSELVPSFLDTVPVDPESQAALELP